MSDFDVLIKKAKKFHGGVCPGIILGTRAAIAGLRELDMSPLEKNRDLVVYVEVDRCMADAIQAITGCSLGHRSLKHMNYGKFAATFVDTRNNKAVRVSVINRARGDPAAAGKDDMVKQLSGMSEAELLMIRPVSVDIPENDLPGFPKHRIACSVCGEQVMDGRETIVDGKPVCRPCLEGPYYTVLEAPSK